MGVVNLPSGKPTMQLTGGALERLKAITPAGHEVRIDVSLTDEGPTAQAIVIIQALPGVSATASEAEIAGFSNLADICEPLIAPPGAAAKRARGVGGTGPRGR